MASQSFLQVDAQFESVSEMQIGAETIDRRGRGIAHGQNRNRVKFERYALAFTPL